MNWFNHRNLHSFSFQSEAINQVFREWEESDIVVLAGCPGSGKTAMSINIIDSYLQSNPGHRVLVLSHGQVILREQYVGSLTNLAVDFDFHEAKNGVCLDSSVNVGIPQGIRNKDLGQVDLLVVDEAHQFYLAPMVQDIIHRTQPQKQLLLSGTPSPFIAQGGYPIVPITIMDIMDSGIVGDVQIQMVSASVDYSLGDFDSSQELRRGKISRNQVVSDLDLVLQKLLQRVSGCKSWGDIAQNLHKTMIVARSQQEARMIHTYLLGKGINPILSISDDGAGSDGFTRFKEIADEKILIVVRRGILGFNLTSLRCVIDMSFGQNIDTLYQLFSRVVRKSPSGEDKLFIKLAPRNLEDYYRYIMTAVLCMGHRDYFLKYNGQNFGELEIPVQVDRNQNRKGKSKPGKMGKIGIRYSSDDLGDFISLNLVKKIIEGGIDGETYALAKISDLRGSFSEKRGWTLEECQEIASKYPSKKKWQMGHIKSYYYANTHGWADKCTNHMDVKRKVWTLEECQEIALQYKNKQEWKFGHRRTYGFAQKHGWIDQCTKHMNVNKKAWTLEECREIALQYKNKREWFAGHNKTYQRTIRMGWQSECKTQEDLKD
jgi:superfamily II DNA or RNA helicase